jgi:DNA-binding protein HU-beta
MSYGRKIAAFPLDFWETGFLPCNANRLFVTPLVHGGTMAKTTKSAASTEPKAEKKVAPFNKGDLIDFVAKQADLPKTQAKNAVEAVLEGIKKNAKKEVRLVGFGTFSIAKRKARTGFNPQTKEKIKIKASKTVKFRPGQAFKTGL